MLDCQGSGNGRHSGVDANPFASTSRLEAKAMIINRVWAMPNKWTFKIPPIAELLNRYVGDGKGWADPFAGMNSPAQLTNDLNPEMPSLYHMDAPEFLNMLLDRGYAESLNGCIFDPPYSFYELVRCYKSIGKNSKWGEHNAFWSRCRNHRGLPPPVLASGSNP